MRVNKIILRFIIPALLLYTSSAEAGSSSLSGMMPVYYPEGIIGNTNPYIIWYDKYSDRDIRDNVKYRIFLKQEKGKDLEPVIIKPSIYGNYLYYKFPLSLEQAKYSYTIERLLDSKPKDSKYYHGLKYPVKGEFEVDPEKQNITDNLPPERLIEYLKAEKANNLQNGYNSLFYGSAALGSFGIGLLFYSVFEFGIISRIIYSVAFISSGAGIGAAGYYGYNYIIEKNQTRKIAEMGNVSINSSITPAMICADFRLSF